MAKQDRIDTLEYFKDFDKETQLQCIAIIHLVASSGMRATEAYRLTEKDIYLDNRIIWLNVSKTGNGRIVLFNNRARISLKEYFS